MLGQRIFNTYTLALSSPTARVRTSSARHCSGSSICGHHFELPGQHYHPQLFGTADQIRSDREGRGSQGTPPAIVQWVCESLVARAQDAGLRV
jgi:hypothetical protein